MARLPKSIIRKYGITKKAWSVFRGRKRSRRKNPSRRTKTRKRSVRRMARRYRRKRGGGGGKSMTRTAFKLIRLGALVANPLRIAVSPISTEEKVKHIFGDFTGYDIGTGQFDMSRLARGWGPYLMACVATYGIPKITSIIRRI